MLKITTADAQREYDRRKFNSIESIFPDKGLLRRELYPKHLEVFAAGSSYRERLFIAANRVGKTIVGAYEGTCHLTGIYPWWWIGKRFSRPIIMWASGDTSKTTRDIIQRKLLGAAGSHGSGMLPKHLIIKTLQKVGIPEAVEIIYVRHVTGGQSICVLKSYDQRREAFQGTEVDFIWPDEEPPEDIYVEMLLRTMTTGGLVLTTFTPLMGLSNVVLSFCPNGELMDGQVKDSLTKHVTTCDWGNVPHLSQQDKDEMLASIPQFQRDARSKGIPQLGSGAIYQVAEEDIVVDDFEIPNHWRRAYGMDVGWNRTAVAWGAVNPDTGVCYLYAEHYVGRQEPIVHAAAVQGRGDWIPGVIDPAARGRGQKDGFVLLDMYTDLGLNIQTANNAVEAGIYEVWERLIAGKIKVFKSLSNWRAEYRVYRRDEKGNIVKSNDHLMDACLGSDTLVRTENGLFKIKDLVGTEGKVYGADGKLKDYKNCRLTCKKAKTIKLTFTDNTEVICTPDHKFMTNKGWIEARYLTDTTRYDNIAICILKSSLISSKNSKEASIGYAANTISVMELDSTERFGGLLIIRKFLKGSISIILTVIEEITNPLILSLNHSESIFQSIKKDTKGSFPNKPCWQQQAGIAVRKGFCGISSMVKNAPRRLCQKILNVKNAESHIKLKTQAEIDSVIQIVKQEPCGNVDVYCMEVPDGNAFVLANGLISHNCRYLIMSGLDIAKVKPVARVTQGSQGYNETGWMV